MANILAPFGLTPEHFARINQMKTDPSSFGFKNQFDYARASGKDLVDRSMTGFGIPSMLGQVAATPFYDAYQGIQTAKEPYSQDFTQYSGITDYGEMPVGPSLSEVAKGIKDQKIGTMMGGRFLGGLESLLDTGKNYASKISDAIKNEFSGSAQAAEEAPLFNVDKVRDMIATSGQDGRWITKKPEDDLMDYDEFYEMPIEEEDEENPWYANLMEYARNNLPNIVGRGALMQAGMGAGAMAGLGLPGVLLGLFAGAKAPFRNTPSMQAFNQLTPAQRQSVGSIYGQGGIMQGYNPVSAFGRGPRGAIQNRINNILGRKAAQTAASRAKVKQLQQALTDVGGGDGGGRNQNNRQGGFDLDQAGRIRGGI